MKHETATLTGAALDYAVAVAEGWKEWDGEAFNRHGTVHGFLLLRPDTWAPSCCWADGGPIIERERLCVCPTGGTWYAYPEGYARNPTTHQKGETALQAAMRCFVAARLGDTITLPEGITP